MGNPVAFSAVTDDNYSYLYYAREDGSIAVLKSSTTVENNKTTYESENILASGNVVRSTSKDISAVSWTDKSGARQVRVYYVSTKPGSGSQLNELVQTNGGKFTQGDLSGNSMPCGKDSLLSASIKTDQSGLKLFYQDQDGNPRVAWNGDAGWLSHPLGHVPFEWQ